MKLAEGNIVCHLKIEVVEDMGGSELAVLWGVQTDLWLHVSNMSFSPYQAVLQQMHRIDDEIESEAANAGPDELALKANCT